MVVDTHGRAFLGNFGFDLMGGAPIETADLLRIDPDGIVTTVAGDMWFANGSVLTDDGVLLVNETFGNRITAFDIAADGTLGNRRAWARFGNPPTERALDEALGEVVVAADGCCLDADGMLWVADAVGARLIRVQPGGEIIDEIQPGTGVFACMLGGHDGRTLFACAAPDFHEQARTNAREASLLSMRVETPHAGLP
jgi:sugar lactone lactonase YvrE